MDEQSSIIIPPTDNDDDETPILSEGNHLSKQIHHRRVLSTGEIVAIVIGTIILISFLCACVISIRKAVRDRRRILRRKHSPYKATSLQDSLSQKTSDGGNRLLSNFISSSSKEHSNDSNRIIKHMRIEENQLHPHELPLHRYLSDKEQNQSLNSSKIFFPDALESTNSSSEWNSTSPFVRNMERRSSVKRRLSYEQAIEDLNEVSVRSNNTDDLMINSTAKVDQENHEELEIDSLACKQSGEFGRLIDIAVYTWNDDLGRLTNQMNNNML